MCGSAGCLSSSTLLRFPLSNLVRLLLDKLVFYAKLHVHMPVPMQLCIFPDIPFLAVSEKSLTNSIWQAIKSSCFIQKLLTRFNKEIFLPVWGSTFFHIYICLMCLFKHSQQLSCIFNVFTYQSVRLLFLPCGLLQSLRMYQYYFQTE